MNPDTAKRLIELDDLRELITFKNQHILDLFEAQLSKHTLGQDDVERLARIAWENTGCKDLPVLPPGHGWVDAVTRKPIPEEQLVSTWEKVNTKDIFRRQAAAVAKALGFKIGNDVKVEPRDLTGKGGAP